MKATHFYLTLPNLHYILEVTLNACYKKPEPYGPLFHFRIMFVVHNTLGIMHTVFTREMMTSSKTGSLEDFTLYLHYFSSMSAKTNQLGYCLSLFLVEKLLFPLLFLFIVVES